MAVRKNTRSIVRVLAVVLLILLTLSVVSLLAAKLIYDSLFPRFDSTDYTLAVNPSYTEIQEEYPRQEVSFLSEENRLQGYIYGTGDKGIIVIAPGLSRGADDYMGITTGFVDMGWRVFTFDGTGSFESEGESSVGFAQTTLDLDSALSYIEKDKELKKLDVFIFGHSRGGYAASCVTQMGHKVKAIATVSGANSPMEVTIDSSKNYVGNFAYFGYPALYAYQSLLFGAEMTAMSASDAIDDSGCKALIIQGAEDDITPPDTCSIYAHKDEIENPNVQYLMYSDEYQSGHSSLLYSEEAAKYNEDLHAEYNRLCEEYPEGIPEDIAEEFYSSVDSSLASTPNPDLMKRVNEFFESAKAQ